MFSKTREFSTERLFNITYRIFNAVLLYLMASFSILTLEMCRGEYDNRMIIGYITFIIPHAINLIITVFAIILFIGDHNIIDDMMRFTIDSIIIFAILIMLYY
jgi:hypothetical protein